MKIIHNGRDVNPGASDWEQVGGNGLGDVLAVFGGKLYAGVDSSRGSRIYATAGGAQLPFVWKLTNDSGFSVNANERIWSSAVYGGKLHVGTYSGLGCEVWRYEGNAWTQVATGGFGDAGNNSAETLAVANGYLYAGATNYQTGAEVWRYDGLKTNQWTQVNVIGFGKKANEYADAMIAAKDFLYVGTWNKSKGGEIWAYDGNIWSQVNTSGFGTFTNMGIESFAGDGTDLYAGTDNDSCGAEVWTTGAGSSNPLIFRAVPFPSIPRAPSMPVRAASRPRHRSRIH